MLWNHEELVRTRMRETEQHAAQQRLVQRLRLGQRWLRVADYAVRRAGLRM